MAIQKIEGAMLIKCNRQVDRSTIWRQSNLLKVYSEELTSGNVSSFFSCCKSL